MKHTSTIFAGSFVAALILSAGPAMPQSIRSLDDEQFIKGLVDRGMSELAEHFLESYQTDDPLLKLGMLIMARKLKAQDPGVPVEARRQAYLEVLDAYRSLIRQAPPSHWKNPIWRTDFAEFALQSVMRERHLFAGEFNEFGSPSLEQERVFKQLAAECATVMDEAFIAMFNLKTDLTRREDFDREFVNTGRWDMLIKEYDELKLPYFHAQAVYYASLLPEAQDEGPLEDAEAAVQALLNRRNLGPDGLGRARVLLARIQVRRGRHEEASRTLDEATKAEGITPYDAFIAQLVRARSLAMQNKNEQALTLLDQAAGGQLPAESPIMLILVFDARHRVTNNPGEYTALLNHPAARQVRGGIQSYINDRIVERKPVAVNDPKAMSIEGKSDLEVTAQAQSLLEQAQRAADAEQKKKLASAALSMLAALLERGGHAPPVEAQIRYRLGEAALLTGETPAAARYWVDLAEKFTDQPVSEPAAINGFKVAHSLYSKNSGDRGMAALFEKAATTLLNSYPHVSLGPEEPASLHRYTLAAFFRQQKNYAQALTHYGLISQDHPFYANAVYEALTCHFAQWLEAQKKEDKDKLAQTVVEAADRAAGVLARTAPADTDRAAKLKRMEGDTLLIKAQVQAESLGEGGRARVALEKFEDSYGQFPELVAAKRQLLVNIYLQLGDVKGANEEVKKFIEASPTDAGPLIKGVLDSLHRQVADAQRVNERDPRIAELRKAGIDMAQELLSWAENRAEIKSDPAKLLYFQVLYGQELIAGGDCDKAVELFQKLHSQPGGDENIDVLLGLGRAAHCAGRLDVATPPLRKIISQAPNLQATYWWQAWLSYLSVLDAQYDELAKTDPDQARNLRDRNIYLKVSQLENATDPELGGQPFKSELIRLKNKNAPR